MLQFEPAFGLATPPAHATMPRSSRESEMQAGTSATPQVTQPAGRSSFPLNPTWVARWLIEDGRVDAARSLLDAAANAGESGAEVRRLRSLLAKPSIVPTPRVDRDRAPEYEWIAHNGHAYRGQWVALLGPRIVAHARSFQELRAAVTSAAPGDVPLLHYVE
jgi:hypothetical protein